MMTPVTRRVSWAYGLSVAVLGLTGMMQMPIAKRYRIAEVPGLAWLGDFWLTHRMHYMAAVVLLFVVGYALTRWMLEWRQGWELTGLGRARALTLALLVATGAVRVLKNLPDVNFAPNPIMLVDWAHLGLAFALGVIALARLATRGSYARLAGRR